MVRGPVRHGLLRARALQPHPAVPGSGDGHGHLLLSAASRRVEVLLDARRFVLVLRRDRHGEPHEVRRHYLLSRRALALRQPVHSVRADVEGQRNRRAAGHAISGRRGDAPDGDRCAADTGGAESAPAVMGGIQCDRRRQRSAAAPGSAWR